MKKLITGLLLIAALVLAGCATDHYPKYMEQAQKTDTANAALVGTYFNAQAARDAVVLTSLKDPTSLVLYGMLQGQRDAALVAQFKGSAIKAPTTGMDLWNTALGNTIPTVIRWGAGYLIAGDLLDALGAGMNVGGDFVSQTNNVDTGGGDFGNSFDYTKTTTTNNAQGDIMLDSYNPTETAY